jgi:hypothetical protein
VKDSLPFVGRTKETKQLVAFYTQRKHVILVGVSGIGKSALLRQVRQSCPFVLSHDSSSLGRICNDLERQFSCSDSELSVIERKNRLLRLLAARGELVMFDHVTHAPPRVARFVAALTERVPVWIVGQSDRREAIGHVWQHLYKFVRIELQHFLPMDTRNLIKWAIAKRRIPANLLEHSNAVHHLRGGNPRILEELLVELGARNYDVGRSSGRKLLALDRKIRDFQLSRESRQLEKPASATMTR